MLALEAVAAELEEMAKPKLREPAEQPPQEPEKSKEDGDNQEEEGGDDEPEQAEEEEPEPEEAIELPESLKPYMEAVAVLKVWTAAFVEGPLGESLLELRGYVLPGTASMTSLLLLVAKICEVDESLANDVFAEKTWEMIRLVRMLFTARCFQ